MIQEHVGTNSIGPDEKNVNYLKQGHKTLSDDLMQLLDFDIERKRDRVKSEFHSKTEEYKDFFNEEETNLLQDFLFLSYELDGVEFYKTFEKKYEKIERIILYAKQFNSSTTMYDESIEFETLEEYENLIKTKSGSIYILDFNDTIIREWSGENLYKAFQIMPKNLKGLDLAFNSFGQLADRFIIELFYLLPKKLKYINLASSDLQTLELENLLTVITSLPESLEVIDLSDNNFTIFDPDDIGLIFSMLPLGLKSLDLGDVEFGKLELEDVKKIFTNLPYGLKRLNLTGCGLEDYSKEEMGIKNGIDVEI